MPSPEIRPPLVVILGPTAVGKTEIAIQLAERLGGEIVSADSRLFYRGMDIGTAKPTLAQRQRVAHHLIDVAEPDEAWSLARFQREARTQIFSIQSRGRLPFLVGGTGQYVRAVVEGWQPPESLPDPELRRALEAWALEIGRQGLYERLERLDPKAAAGIDYRNLRRTVRALEVIFTTGRLFSEQRGSGPVLYHLVRIGLTRPRTEIYARIDARIQEMFEAGLVEEVQALLSKGYTPDLPGFSAIGYREVAAFLRGENSLEEAKQQMKRATRVFVRRQANWFKVDDPRITWFLLNGETVDEIEAFIRHWLPIV
jgi:tRNA dimethylallyltransferase